MLDDVRSATPATRRRTALAVLLTGQVMASIDASIVSVAAPTIRTGLAASDADIQLIVSGYLLTTGVLFVTCARIGDLVGHRRAFLVGVVWFTAASLLCGLAVNPLMLITARIGQAVGAALLMPQVFSMIHREWEGAQRRRAIGLYGMVLALGVALGQVIGGVVVTTDLFGLGWRPVFLINVPLGALVVVLGLRRLPRSGRDPAGRLDPTGVALLTVAMASITLPLIFGADHDWPLWSAVMIIAGGGLLALFVRHEARARHPVLDLAALRPPEVRWGMVSCCVVMGCYTVFLLILTVHLQSQLDYTPLEAGLTFVPYTLGFGALSLTWNSFPGWLQRTLPIAGPVVFAVGLLLVVVLHRDHWNPVASAGLLFLAGVGHAASYSPLIARITSRVGPRLGSAVSALNSTGPVLAEVTAVAGLGTVYFTATTSSAGLLRVTVTIGALLLLAAGCSAVATSALGRPRQESR